MVYLRDNSTCVIPAHIPTISENKCLRSIGPGKVPLCDVNHIVANRFPEASVAASCQLRRWLSDSAESMGTFWGMKATVLALGGMASLWIP
jgi:hypothetical protein